MPRVVDASSARLRIDTSGVRVCAPTLAAGAAALPGDGERFAPWDGPGALMAQWSRPMRGSTASRSASPNSVKPSVANASATLETTTGTQLSDRYW